MSLNRKPELVMPPDVNESNQKLDRAVVHCQQKLDLCPAGSPGHLCFIGELANALNDRFQQLGQIEDLEEAIKCHSQALDLCPLGHPDRSVTLNSLAIAICTRFKQQGRLEDLEGAITCSHQALYLCPPGHPDRSASLYNLALTTWTRFMQQGQSGDLEEAITCSRRALDLRPLGHAGRSASLNVLANALHTRFTQQGQNKDLEEAITCHHEALDLRPPGHPCRSHSLCNFGIAVHTRFIQQGRIEDLEEAITCQRRALNLRTPSDPNRPSCLNNLAIALNTRFNQQGQIEDLEEAITCHREALDLRPPGHHYRPASLNNLTTALSDRFHRQGQNEDLDEVIKCNREGLDLRPPGDPYRSASLMNLALGLLARFNQQGQDEDLEEAITCNREALNLRAPGHPERYMALSSLAKTLYTRFNQQGRIGDLEEAITCYRKALDLCRPRNLDLSITLMSLAKAICTRFSQQGQIEDLKEAITSHHGALDPYPPDHPECSVSLNNPACAIFTRFRRLGRTEDLEEAIKHLSDADNTMPILHPLHAELWSCFATAYLLRHESHSRPDDCLPQAFRHFESAANHSTATLMERFDAALEWAEAARHHQHHSILQAYSVSLTLLDHHLNVTPDIVSKQHLLATTSSIPRSLASDAAACAIGVGQLETAIEFLEQGRAILWSKLQGYRYPLEQLRDIDSQLADHFEALSGRLEHHAISAGFPLVSPGPQKAGPAVSADLDAKIRQHRLLSEEWDSVVQRIRQIEGFAHFLQAVPFTTLQLAAAEGPVIVVNISRYRADAIILHGVAPPVLVPLPGTSPENLALLSAQLSDALTQRSLSIRRLLRQLWDTIVCPVRDKLALLGVAEQSRIWWCPTAELCALPLHAAGPYKHRERNLPDIYISSYTPTLSALIRARSGIVNRPALPSFLVMGQPGENLEVGMLPNVKEEIRRIHSYGDFVEVLVAGDANRQTVLPRLQRHTWIHFACHGHQALQPFLSSFELHGDEQLTLIDLIKARLPHAEFAFLSACHSAAGDTGNTPDEAINLAAALQFCGFRSVVGTLWAMADRDGPDVAEDFYGYMFRDLGSVDFRDSAKALNLATRAMRKRKRMTIDRWINFVHIGA